MRIVPSTVKGKIAAGTGVFVAFCLVVAPFVPEPAEPVAAPVAPVAAPVAPATAPAAPVAAPMRAIESVAPPVPVPPAPDAEPTAPLPDREREQITVGFCQSVDDKIRNSLVDAKLADVRAAAAEVAAYDTPPEKMTKAARSASGHLGLLSDAVRRVDRKPELHGPIADLATALQDTARDVSNTPVEYLQQAEAWQSAVDRFTTARAVFADGCSKFATYGPAMKATGR